MRIVCGLLLAVAAACAGAQTYPAKPLRVVVPQPPGGGFDMVARTLSEPLAGLLGQPAIVENYTLVARNDLPFRSLKEVVDFARANPGKLSYASGGNGSGQHICAALLWHATGVNITHVPYKGAQIAYQDLIPGRVDMFFDASSTARSHIEAGRVKPVAVSGPARLPFHPAVPTVRETGVADFEMETWVGYFVRSGTPEPIVARLRADFDKVAAMPETAATLEKRGALPIRISGREAEGLLARDIEKWAGQIRSAGITAD